MPDTAKYDVYRVRQPLVKDRSRSLFVPDVPVEEARVQSLTRAIEIGRQSEGQWIAGQPVEIIGGIAFKVGHREEVKNYTYEDGDFKPRTDLQIRLTDVFLDYPSGVMLVRRDKDAPSPFLISQALKQWLKQANAEMETSFDTIVQAIPFVEDFLAALRGAENISRLSFVVHGPNPANEDAIVEQLTLFTQEHGIQSTTVSLNSESIEPGFAQRIAVAAGRLGDSVSATIKDAKSAVARTIRMKRKPRSIAGPSNPSPEDGRRLLDDLQRRLDDVGVGSDDGGKPKTRSGQSGPEA